MRDIGTLKPVRESIICLRLANAKPSFDQDFKKHDPAEGERPLDYELPELHNIERQPDIERASQIDSTTGEKKEDVVAVEDEVE